MKNKKSKTLYRKLLLIDDNIIFANVMELYFKDYYKVINFSGPDCYNDCLSHIRKTKKTPSIAIVDIFLGNGKSGVDLAEELLTSGVNNIIFLTGCNANDPLYIETKKMGYKIIDKPVSLKTLKNEIDELGNFIR